MNASQRQTLARLIEAIDQAADEVQSLEEEAHAALFEAGDRERHGQLLEQKAIVIIGLEEETEDLIPGLPEALGGRVQSQLAHFAKLAGMALDLSSAFFLRTMLHPVEDWETTPNDLKLLAEELKGQAGEG